VKYRCDSILKCWLETLKVHDSILKAANFLPQLAVKIKALT